MTEANTEIKSTTFAKWRDEGKVDPHGELYSGDLANIAKGHVSHIEILNKCGIDIVSLTVVKERIRWLNRRLFQLASNEQRVELCKERAALPHGDYTDDELGNAFYLEELPFLYSVTKRLAWLIKNVERIEKELIASIKPVIVEEA